MFKDPKMQAAAAMVTSLLALSTIYFHLVEKWTLFDSFYFSVVTMSTVGYGQIVPATFLGKAGVIVLIFSGVGMLAILVQIVASNAIENRTRRVQELEEEVEEQERALLDQLQEIRRRKKKS